MGIGKSRAVCRSLVVLMLAAMMGEAGAQTPAADTPQHSARWPKPSENALNLVRAMREDETVLIAARKYSANDKVKSRCVARMQPAMLTAPIGSAAMLMLSPAEIDEAVRFYQTDVGRKTTEIKIAQVRDGIEDPFDPRLPQLTHPEMQVVAEFAKSSAGLKMKAQKISAHVGVQSEFYDYVSRCEAVLTGERPSTYCSSEPVFSESKACSAAYAVTQRAGQPTRRTSVRLTCTTNGRPSSFSLVAELEGQHETIGFNWPDENTLEVLLPPGAKTVLKRTESHGKPPQKFVYRNRKAKDAPAKACVRDPGFIDPAKVD